MLGVQDNFIEKNNNCNFHLNINISLIKLYGKNDKVNIFFLF